MTAPRAIVTGIRGQDGYYLSRALSERGYEIIGTTREAVAADTSVELAGIRVGLRTLDLTSSPAIEILLREVQPRLFFNLAARASSAQLFDDPIATAEVNGLAVMRMLEAIRRCDATIRFCQASSSEVFAGAREVPQSECTLRAPTSAYGAAKAFADHCVAAYRATFGVFACSAILFPHESPRRDPHFLVRKVVRAAVRIAAGGEGTLSLGDLDAERDWGAASDYMEAMVAMATADAPDDFVIATGRAHSVRDVCHRAFERVGLDFRDHVVSDPMFTRATEPVVRVGDASRARARLGWEPKVSFDELVRQLVDAERALRAD